MGKRGSVKLVLPKNSGSLEYFNDAISMVVKNNGIMEMSEFIQNIDGNESNLNVTSLYHKSVLPRFFGMLFLDKSNKQLKITPLGMSYYLAIDSQQKIDVIIDALGSVQFGRNNNAVDSDSSIEAPIVFLKVIQKLKEASPTEIGCILYFMEVKSSDLEQAINLTISNPNINSLKESIIGEIGTKLFDLKFNVLFEEIGIVEKENGKYRLSQYVMKTYSDKILKMEEIDMFSTLGKIENVYWPSLDEYNPNVSKEQWKKFVLEGLDKESLHFQLLLSLYKNGGESDFLTLAENLGKNVISAVIGESGIIGLKAKSFFSIKGFVENGEEHYLSIPFQGKFQFISGRKIYSLKMRNELFTAFNEISSSNLNRYLLNKVEIKNTDAEYAEVLNDLIKKCGSDWDGIRLFGAIYCDIIDSAKYDRIRTLAGLKDTSKSEFLKGKAMGKYVVSKDLLIRIEDEKNFNAVVGEEVDVKQLILDRYHARTDFDIVTTRQKYAKFKSLYSKQALLSLDGIDLLKRLFAPKDMDENSLTYNLEHNSYYGEFGGIGGGSQFKYPLYFYSKKQKWCTGPSLKSQTELTEEEAIEKAKEIRTKFVALFDLVESTDLTHVENYALIQNLLNSDSLYRKIWVFKYLHMLYPDKFSNFYSWEWLIKVTKFLGLPEGSSVMMNGEISSFAAEIKIHNVFLAQIIHELLPSVDDENIDEIDDENENEEEEETMIIELPERSPRTYKKYPLNLVLYGAPGTGKTYSTMELACSIIDRGSASIDDICEGNTHANRAEVMEHYNSLVKQGFITFTTFHQSYGYEDFIQGLRPDDKSESLKFVPVDGVFKKIVNKAIKDQTNNYVIIIDEINRANISKVLGELITLLETDKRWGEINQLSAKLPSGQPFAVPNNLYVIGTMNSADKSISLIDAALRRRFEFVEVSVNYKTIANSTTRSVLKKINEKLEGQLDSSDLLVGHAYFIGKDENSVCDVLNHNVIPLLYEYFYDSKAKVKDVLKYALDGLNYQIEDESGKRLRVIKA